MIALVALLISSKFSTDLGYGDIVALNFYKYFEVEAKGKLAFSADEDVLVTETNTEEVVVEIENEELLKSADLEDEAFKENAGSEETTISQEDFKKEEAAINNSEIEKDNKKEEKALDKKKKSTKKADKQASDEKNDKFLEIDVKKYPCKDVATWIEDPSSYDGKDKLVFFTFDDGPSLSNTPRILDILKEEKVKATFFVLGTCASQNHAGNTIKREFDEGHTVGLHTFTHEYSFLYPNRSGNVDNIMSEIDENIEAIRKHLGDNYIPTTFRYPGGHMSWYDLAATDEALAQRGIHYIDWNVGAGDAVYKDNPAYYRTALENVKLETEALSMPDVVVVLMHDSNPKVVDDLKDIIHYFRDNGYEFAVLE